MNMCESRNGRNAMLFTFARYSGRGTIAPSVCCESDINPMLDSRVSRTRPSVRFVALILILLLGWMLRTHHVQSRSFWEDEGWTMLLSQGPGLDDITRTMAADQHPPLFFMAFRLWRNVTGDTEFATRYFSVLIGMVAVAGIYQLGRELFSPEAGLLAALVLALSDLHIDLSQEVRHYSLLATFAVLSSLYYVRWWHRPSRANRVGYVLTSILMLYTHYLGGYVLVAQLIHMLLVVRPRRRLFEALFLFGAICLGFLPWLPVVIDQNRVRWTNPLYYQNALPNSVQTYRAVRTALLGHYYALIGGLMLLGLVHLIYRRPEGRYSLRVRLRPLWPTLYLVIWIVLMAGLTVAINERRQFLTVRNFILVVPAVAVLVGHGLTNLEHTARVFMVGVMLVVGLTTVDARRQYPNWRAVTRNVTEYHLDNEPILMDVWVGDFAVRYYIDRQMGKGTPRVSLREWRDQYGVQFLPTLQHYLQTTDAFWLIYWGDKPMDEYGSLIDQAGFRRTAALSVDHLGTPLYSYRYDKLTAATVATFADLFTLRKFGAPATASPGQTITVALWWTAEQVPPLDYSVSVFLLDQAGKLVAQHDEPPLEGTSPTSGWQPGELKFDPHRIVLPSALPAGSYQLGLKVYWYGDRLPLPVSQDSRTGGEYARLGTVEVRLKP
jgi:hypothetical protein